ncbi:hypothetical protein [Cronobacter sakazakii]|uniref:hypothetical protein n=1 Tax=Cronobacter sakazakii TaxID=28141 RepID=UPI000BE79608|nr:hypothetical protein [Cronobacter sakazakii]PUV45899.1 hypothetical protein CDU03_06325 [Cronobacter sakazakii]
MDKSREQFESYFIQYYLNDNPEMVELFLKRDGEGYKLPSPNDEWRVWQASRAAVEVELPALAVDKDHRLAAEIWPEEGFNLAVTWMRRALKAAGLKVKGE